MFGNKAPNWDEFEKFMEEKFSFAPKDEIKNQMGRSTNWVGDLVQKVSKDFYQQVGSFNPFANSGFNYEIFETNRSVFVKCRVPKGASPDDYKFSVSKGKLKLMHEDREVEIVLPCNVNPYRSKAEYKKGKFEIRMPKSRKREYFRDIPMYDL